MLGVYQLRGDQKKTMMPLEHEAFESLPSFFSGYRALLDTLKKEEHYNLFVTLGSADRSKDASNRKTLQQEIFPIDIDGLTDCPADLRPYLKIFSDVLGVPQKDFCVLFSGHGLHTGFLLKTPLAYSDFKKYRPAYIEICKK